MNNKILITGADGLTGSAIRRLNPEGAVYLGKKDLDLLDFKKTKEVFKELSPEKVVHLAAQVGGVGANIKHPGQFFFNNTVINVNVLEAARLAGVKKLVSFMSTCVFPDDAPHPLNEKDIHKGPPHPSNFGYAYAKRMLDVQSRAYRQEYGCHFTTVIPTNIYGPNDNFSLTDGHVMPSLIHKTYLAKKNNTDLMVWGTGKPLREFVYSEDIAHLALWMLDNYDSEEPIILSSGYEVSIKELVEIIVKKIGFEGKVVFDHSKPDGQFNKPSDTSKLKLLYPEFRWTTVSEGVEKTVNWFLDNYPNIKI